MYGAELNNVGVMSVSCESRLETSEHSCVPIPRAGSPVHLLPHPSPVLFTRLQTPSRFILDSAQ